MSIITTPSTLTTGQPHTVSWRRGSCHSHTNESRAVTTVCFWLNSTTQLAQGLFFMGLALVQVERAHAVSRNICSVLPQFFCMIPLYAWPHVSFKYLLLPLLPFLWPHVSFKYLLLPRQYISCLLWRNKSRAKQKTYKSVGVMKD